MRMHIHWIYDQDYLQKNIMDKLQCIINIWIGIRETKGVTKENCQLLPSGDLFVQLNRYIPRSWYFIQCVDKGMDPLILWSRYQQGLTLNQLITRTAPPIVPSSTVHFYISKVNCHQSPTLQPVSDQLLMGRPPMCRSRLQCFLQCQQPLWF